MLASNIAPLFTIIITTCRIIFKMFPRAVGEWRIMGLKDYDLKNLRGWTKSSVPTCASKGATP